MTAWRLTDKQGTFNVFLHFIILTKSEDRSTIINKDNKYLKLIWKWNVNY